MTAFKHKTQIGQPRRRALPAGTILNSAGQPVKAVTAPVGAPSMENRIERLNAWREHYNPLRGLTIARAIQLVEDYQAGRMADLQWVYYFMEQTDPDMIGLLENRLSRLLEMDYDVLVEEEADDESLATEQQDFIGEKLSAIDNLYEAIEHLAMSPFRGFAHAEKWFNREGAVFHFEVVDQWNVVRDGLRGPWRYNPTARSTDYLGLQGQPDLPLERFLYRESRRPINRYALLKYIRAGLSEKDWDAFNELYNLGSGVVIGPPDVPEGEEADYELAAQKVAGGGSGYLPHGAQYVPNEMPHDPSTFEKRLDYLSKKLVLAGTGGQLTMLAESGSGTLAGSVHDEVFNRIARAEARRISEIFNKQLVAAWLEEAFPGQKQVAYFRIAANEETDTGDAVEQVSKLAAAGYQVAPEQVTEKTGWVVVLKPTPAALPEPDTADPATDAAADPADKVKNRAGDPAIAAATEVRFLANSDRALSVAEQAALQPVIDLVLPMADAADDAAFLAANARLQRELPDLEAAILSVHPELETALTDILATAFRSGLEEAAAARSPAVAQKPARNRKVAPAPGRRRKTRQR